MAIGKKKLISRPEGACLVRQRCMTVDIRGFKAHVLSYRSANKIFCFPISTLPSPSWFASSSLIILNSPP